MFFSLENSRTSDWYVYLNKIKNHDIYYTPEYNRLFELNGDGRSYLIIYEEGEYVVCYPILLRPLRNIKRFASDNGLRSSYDIVTVYGYSGPLTNAQEQNHLEQIMERFSDEFERYCQNNGIVTETVFFHPLLKNHRNYPGLDLVYLKDTIAIDLSKGLEYIYADMTAECRNQIRKAKKHLTVKLNPENNLEAFKSLYYKTMDRKSATSYYYFDEDFFNNLTGLMKSRLQVIEIMYGSQVIAAGIFLIYNCYVHYFLSGSQKEYLNYCPNNLLIESAILEGHQRGYAYLHMGAGVKANDSLFAFKASFSKSGRNEYFIGKKVRNEDVYHQIVSGLSLQSNDYFPIYRSPKLLDELT